MALMTKSVASMNHNYFKEWAGNRNRNTGLKRSTKDQQHRLARRNEAQAIREQLAELTEPEPTGYYFFFDEAAVQAAYDEARVDNIIWDIRNRERLLWEEIEANYAA